MYVGTSRKLLFVEGIGIHCSSVGGRLKIDLIYVGYQVSSYSVALSYFS